ncbi:MAG TPA: hypothetical protein VF587_14325, partial [Solirubrobacteraceae bacterium]
SAFFAVAYVGGISIPVVGVGIASRHFGLIATAEAFAAIVGALALAALVRVSGRPRRTRVFRGAEAAGVSGG